MPARASGADDDAAPSGNLADLVSAAARRGPEHPALVDITLGRTLSWADFDRAVDAEVERLRSAGVSDGDRVLVRLGSGIGFAVAVLGAVRSGAIAVPVGPAAVARELEMIRADCAPRIVVTGPGDEAVAGMDAVVGVNAAAGVAGAAGIEVLPPPDLDAVPGAAVQPNGGGEDIALLVYTSGSTGLPRGVQLSHRALLANRRQVAALRPAPVIPSDRVLVSLPLFHIFGLGPGLLQVCHAGATVVLVERFDAARTIELITEQRVSAVSGVPSMYRSLLDLPAGRLRAGFAGVRLCTAGGAPLPPRWLAEFRSATGLDVFEGYGLTEGGPVVTSNQVGGQAKPGSVGAPLPGVELRLVDASGDPLDGERAEQDGPLDDDDDDQDTGLVALRGPNLFSGYWPDGAGGPDAEGWFRTGDVGFLDSDGDLHLVDRLSDLVIVNGFNVFPREVEQVLLEHPDVAEAAVVGIPDERAGEAVKAVLVQAEGAGLTVQDVRAHCATRLARFKVPTVIEFVDAMPRSATGKIDRRALR